MNEPGQISWEQATNPDTFVGWDFHGRQSDGIRDDWFIPDAGLIMLSWQAKETDMVPVPILRGASIEAAERRLKAAGLQLGEVLYDYCGDGYLDLNTVVTTQPYRYAQSGQAVDVVVNLGRFTWDEERTQSPLEIRTPGQLDCLAAVPGLWDRYYVLAADLDMTGWTYERPLFDGIFEGTLDGQGHTVSNLVIDQLFGETVALFREIGARGYVGHVNLAHLSVSGGNRVGGIAGTNGGVLDGVSVEATVTGLETLGGLVGINRGHLLDCRITGRINKSSGLNYRPGTLVGCNDGGAHVQCSTTVECPYYEEPLDLVGSGSCGGSTGSR
jgi:hypothetical protein